MRKIFYFIFAITLVIFGCSKSQKYNLSEVKELLASTAKIDSVKLKKAIETVKNELEANPESKSTIQLLVTAYSKMSRSDSAVMVLTISIQKYEKGLAEFYQARSMNYFILKNNDMAIEDVKNAIEYDPSNTILYKQLVFLTIYKKFNTPNGWLEFAEKDIAKIIDDVYPNEMEKPTVDEFNDVTEK